VQNIRAVLFDFHTTLVDGGDPARWISQAIANIGEPPPENLADAADFLDRIWEHVNEVDPDSSRDLDPASHRRIYNVLMEHARQSSDVDISPALADELYRIMGDQWRPYADARPVLRCLREAGIRTALISNVGIDIREILDRDGLSDYLDTVVLSCHVGVVKPDAAIFEHAIRALGVHPAECLMVGDSHLADAGAAAIGIRTLLLPRTEGRVHGLDIVCRIVGIPFESQVDWYDL
jgi:HAD superfamily hydrolase (TIGR01509 family)